MPMDDIGDFEREVTKDITNCFQGAFGSRLEANETLEFGFVDREGNRNGGLAYLVGRNEDVVAIPWAYRCTHDGFFLGVAPTYLDIVLRGATFVDTRSGPDDRDNWIYYRYVDYLGALQQIGVTTATRPVVTPEQYDVWEGQHQLRHDARARERDEWVAAMEAEEP
jgi:hypothetical protein